jgi:hypothetical protein
MKKYILGSLLALVVPATAHAEDKNFPGSAWVNVTGPHVSGEEKGNWVLSGRIEQDAVLTEVADWKLAATTGIGFSTDTKGFEWNNKIVPSVGVKATREAFGGVMNVTVQYAYERRFGKLYKTDDRSDGGVQVVVNYWTGWGR